MTLLIHANVRATGAAEELAAFRDQVNRLLLDDYSDADVEERHREGELVYDFKVSGGIPFPPFVAASGSHPDVTIQVEWVNAEAGVKGFAAIEDGRLKESRTEKLADAGRHEELTSVSIADDGALTLALTFLVPGPGEYIGYAVTSDRDALVRVIRRNDQSVELYASSGDQAQWDEKWVIDLAEASYEHAEISEPIDEALYLSLRRHAEEFAAEWLWFDSALPVDTAIERERFRVAGYRVNAANVKYEKLKSLLREPRRFTSEPLRPFEDAIRQCLADDQ